MRWLCWRRPTQPRAKNSDRWWKRPHWRAHIEGLGFSFSELPEIEALPILLIALAIVISLSTSGVLWALSLVYDRFQQDRPGVQIPKDAEVKRYGQAWHYTANRWLVVAMPLNLLMIPLFVGLVQLLQHGPVDTTTSDIFCGFIPIAVAVLAGYAILFGPGFVTNLYPEIALDGERLWYRFAYRWRWVSWRRVHYLRRAQSYMGAIGILIYADGLPRSCASYSRLYSGHKGRAIVVFNNIGNADELATDIHLRIQASRPASTR